MSARIAAWWPLAAAICVSGMLSIVDASAHPSEDALHKAATERAQCATTERSGPSKIDPARIGMSESDLRRAVSALPAKEHSRNAGPWRLSRTSSGALAAIDYDLAEGQVYAIRWRLARDFERPVLDELVRRAKICLGRPEFDQTFEAEPGSATATYRRIVWRHGAREIELRQLHPLRGGPVYLVVRSREPIRAMGAAGTAPLPEPDRSAPWWQRSLDPVAPAGHAEREALGERFARLLAQIDH